MFQALDRPLYNSLECRNGVHLQVSPNNGIDMGDPRALPRVAAEHARARLLLPRLLFCAQFEMHSLLAATTIPSPSSPLLLSTCCRPVPAPSSHPIRPITAKQSLRLAQQQQINANPAAQFSAPPLSLCIANERLSDRDRPGDGLTHRPPLVFQSLSPPCVSEPLADFSNPLGAL